MANKPLAYTLTERKATIGKMAGKIVLQARPTGRKRIDHRNFCDEVARATTFTGAEVEAVLRLAAEIAKRYVEKRRHRGIWRHWNAHSIVPKQNC